MLWEGIKMEQRESAQVAYVPKILRNMAEICKEMGVGRNMVRKWVNEGAPIVTYGRCGKKRYLSEAMMLYQWLQNKTKT